MLFKKVVLGIATISLSLGIVGNANAEALPVSLSPVTKIEGNSSLNPIVPLNNQIFHQVSELYPKSKYPMAADTPKTLFVAFERNGNKYGGTLTKTGKIENGGKYGDYWRVYYSGMVTRFIE